MPTNDDHCTPIPREKYGPMSTLAQVSVLNLHTSFKYKYIF